MEAVNKATSLVLTRFRTRAAEAVKAGQSTPFDGLAAAVAAAGHSLSDAEVREGAIAALTQWVAMTLRQCVIAVLREISELGQAVEASAAKLGPLADAASPAAEVGGAEGAAVKALVKETREAAKKNAALADGVGTSFAFIGDMLAGGLHAVDERHVAEVMFDDHLARLAAGAAEPAKADQPGPAAAVPDILAKLLARAKPSMN